MEMGPFRRPPSLPGHYLGELATIDLDFFPGAVAKITASSLAEGTRLTSMRRQIIQATPRSKHTPGRCRVGAPLRIDGTSQCHCSPPTGEACARQPPKCFAV